MNISNNIIKQNLKNVFFVCGGSCGGKSTISKILAKKHNLELYPPSNYKETSSYKLSNKEQPNLTLDIFKSPIKYYSQEPKEFSEYIKNCDAEIAEFVVADLLSYPKEKKVIVDSVLPIELLKEISDYDHVVLLYTSTEKKKREYFQREEKLAEYKLIMELPNPEHLMSNYLNALTYNDDAFIDEIIASGFKYIERADKISIKDTVRDIEAHFGLK